MDDLSNDEVGNLLNQIANGDDQAAKQLYQRYFGFLYSYVRHQLADSAAAEDVTQEVFVSVFLKPQAFADQSKLSTWLCGIAKNKCVDWWRKNGNRLDMCNDADSVQDDQIDPNWDLLANLQTQQDRQAMRDCVDALPPEQREAIFWVYFQDAGLEAVAKHLDCPTGTVKSRLFNARKKLRGCMSRRVTGASYV